MLRSAVYALLIKNNKILLTRRCNTEFYDGYYNLPCGHIDGGESATNAIKREVKEEVGIKVLKKDFEFVHLLHRIRDAYDGKFEYMDLFFLVKKWDGQPINCELEYCDDLCWFELNNLPKKIIPYQKKIIKNIINKLTYSEIGFK